MVGGSSRTRARLSTTMDFPNVLVARDSDEDYSDDSSSSSDEEEEEEEQEEEEEEAEREEQEEDEEEEEMTLPKKKMKKKEMKRSMQQDSSSEKKPSITISISLKKVCKVCKGTGHEAGFKGATYVDCPKKPCFLCKHPGHTTMTCPHKVATEHGVVPPTSTNNSRSLLGYVFERQLRANVPMVKPKFVIPNQVDCAVIRLHSRRVTCLEFHPANDGILLSADKKGQLGIWDYNKVCEKTVYESIHSCILNSMKFSPQNSGNLYTASSDGTVSCTDLETGLPFRLMDLNPDGWNGPATWRMLYGLDVNPDKHLVLVADNFGYLYMLDARANKAASEPILIHKKGTKVVGLHCNPVQPELLLTCGNDHFARIWDLRLMESGSSLDNLTHTRVVNSAYFSPHTGTKILTTSQDNRLRVWDSVFGDLGTPSRVIVHSHDFNRHLTCFRAEWDPKDPSESLAVVGRYISENYDGVALHPIDFIDVSTGQLVGEVVEPNITTISPVNKLHPRDDVMATGSSRSLFIWRPKEHSEQNNRTKALAAQEWNFEVLLCGNNKDEKTKGKKGKYNSESDDNDDDENGKKKEKVSSSFKVLDCKKPSKSPSKKSKR